MIRGLPKGCPSCGKPLAVKRLACAQCDTAVEGDFPLPLLARLEPAEGEFLLNLLEAGGSLKDLAAMYRLSYPTVRNRLDTLRAKMAELRRDEGDWESKR